MSRLLFLSACLLMAIFGAYSAARPRAVIAAYRRMGVPTNLFGYEILVWRIGGAVLVAWSLFLAVLLLRS